MNPGVKVISYNSPVPFLYYQDLFAEEELKLIYSELDFYQESKDIFFQTDTSQTNGATDSNGDSLKRNGGFFMNNLWGEIKSPIGRFTCDIFNTPILNHPSNYFFNDFNPELNGFLVSYYESQDCYKPHRDTTVATLVIWLWKEPKKFNGGDFHFTDFPNVKLNTSNNCAVLFPGQYKHHVNPVKMNNGFSASKEDGFGRYSFTLFMNHAIK